MHALGDSTRCRVFEQLRDGPKSVRTLAERLPVSRPAVSQHLKVLKNAGLVQERPEGTRRIYSIRTDGLEELKDRSRPSGRLPIPTHSSSSSSEASPQHK